MFTAATVRPSPPSAEAPACDRFRRAWESGPSAWHHRHRGRGHRDRRAWTRDRPYHGIGWGPESCEGASDGQVRGECCGDTHGSRRFQSSNHNVPLGRHEDTLVHSESQSHQRGGDDHQRSHDILQSPTTHRCAYKRSRPPPPHASRRKTPHAKTHAAPVRQTWLATPLGEAVAHKSLIHSRGTLVQRAANALSQLVSCCAAVLVVCPPSRK